MNSKINAKNRPLIKICGLKKKEDIQSANVLNPDMIGFVFYPKSNRYVTPEQAKELRRQLNPRIQAVGVFVDENPEVILNLLKEDVIDMAQLHGQESEEVIAYLQRESGKRIIRAFQIKEGHESQIEKENQEILRQAEHSMADEILIDSGQGSGKTLDFEVLKNIKRPYILAGGLTPDNIEKVLQLTNAYGVDVSSGVEIDGSKDYEKMKQFIEKAAQKGQEDE